MKDTHRKYFWSFARWLAGIAIGFLALQALNGDKGELTEAFQYLSHPNIAYLLLAICLEIMSVVSYSYLQLRLLKSANVEVSPLWMSMVSFAALTISSSLPAGPAFSFVYIFRQYKRKGADDIIAGWTLFATFAFTAMALACLAAAGALIAYGESSSYDLLYVIGIIFLIVTTLFVLFWQRTYVFKLILYVLKLSFRIARRPGKDPTVAVEKIKQRITAIPLTGESLAYKAIFAFGNWLFDCACLALAFLSVGASIPWRGLLLAYGAGQLAQNLPITPGGLGVTEGSLTVAIVAFGGAETTTVAAVLLYRIISFWGYIPLGWLDYLILRFLESKKGNTKLADTRKSRPALHMSADIEEMVKDCAS
ncbi:MAG: YbhN family protein [Firmicutes bacterium]|nr:YbhN family protein [Bacillota bacterium]